MHKFSEYASPSYLSNLISNFGYKKHFVSTIIILFNLSFIIVWPSYSGPHQSPEPPESSNVCEAIVTKKVILDCSYHPGTGAFVSSPHLRLVHASLSFEIKGENYMSLSLQVANEDTVRLAERRPVFVEIDDTKGKNYLRRPLPHTDLDLVGPGETRTFSEKLLVGSLLPGDYIVFLWIPSSETDQTFNSKQNFLLSGESIASPDSGLNKLAQFKVIHSIKR